MVAVPRNVLDDIVVTPELLARPHNTFLSGHIRVACERPIFNVEKADEVVVSSLLSAA